MSISKPLFTPEELETLQRREAVTVNCSVKRTIEDGEVTLHTTCICDAATQIRRSKTTMYPFPHCKKCKRAIFLQSHEKTFDQRNNIPNTWVFFKVKQLALSRVHRIGGEGSVHLCEGSYQGIVDSSIDLCEVVVEFTNMGTEPFEYHIYCSEDMQAKTITVDSYNTLSYALCAKEAGSGISTYVLKRPWTPQSIFSMDDWFSNPNSTLLQIDFAVIDEKILAFCMIGHERLGKQSTYSLDRELISMICKFHWVGRENLD